MGYLSPLTHFKKQKFNTALIQLKRKKKYPCFRSTFGNICDPRLSEQGLCGLSIYISEILQEQKKKFPKY